MVEKVKAFIKWIIPNTYWATLHEQTLFDQNVKLFKELTDKQREIDYLKRQLESLKKKYNEI